jgi:DNA-binding transcriptional LysR family regulator
LKLRALQVLREVAASGSQASASRTLNIAPSAISRTIAQLEDELGFALFRREKGRLIATQPGRAFAAEVERVFREIDGLGDTAAGLRLQGGDRIRAMFPPSLSQRFLPDCIVRFAKSHPDTMLDVDYGSARAGVAALAEGRIDLAIMTLPVDVAGYETVPLLDIETVCLIPRSHRLARLAAIEAKDLDREPMVLINRPFALRGRLEELFRRAGVAPKVRVETSSGQAAMGCARAGIGIAVVSRLTALQAEGDGSTVVRPFRPTLWQKFVAVLGPSAKGTAVDGFVKALKATAASYRRLGAGRRYPGGKAP